MIRWRASGGECMTSESKILPHAGGVRPSRPRYPTPGHDTLFARSAYPVLTGASRCRILESWRSPNPLWGLGEHWCHRRDSNPGPQPYQGCALPLSYGGDEARAIAKARAGVKRKITKTELDVQVVSPHPHSAWKNREKRPLKSGRRRWSPRSGRICDAARQAPSRLRSPPIRTSAREAGPLSPMTHAG